MDKNALVTFLFPSCQSRFYDMWWKLCIHDKAPNSEDEWCEIQMNASNSDNDVANCFTPMFSIPGTQRLWHRLWNVRRRLRVLILFICLYRTSRIYRLNWKPQAYFWLTFLWCFPNWLSENTAHFKSMVFLRTRFATDFFLPHIYFILVIFISISLYYSCLNITQDATCENQFAMKIHVKQTILSSLSF